jgi:hypothetical protein
MWKFEIEDPINIVRDEIDNTLSLSGFAEGEAGDMLAHDELFRQYPQLEDTKVRIMGGTPEDTGGYRGGFGWMKEDGQGGYVQANPQDRGAFPVMETYASTPDEASSTLVHELNHGVQGLENYASGGSADAFADATRRANPAYDTWSSNPELVAEAQALKADPAFSEQVEAAGNAMGERMARKYKELQLRVFAGEVEPDEANRIMQEYERTSILELSREYPLAGRMVEIAELTPIDEPPKIIPPEQAYVETAGEVSSRAAQARMGLDSNADVLPIDSYDVPVEDINVGFRDTGVPPLEQHLPPSHPLAPDDVAFTTHEAIPSSGAGHLPDAVGAPYDERLAFSRDPRSRWDVNTGGQGEFAWDEFLREDRRGTDALYAPNDYSAPPPRTTNPATGVFTDPEGLKQNNPSFVGRPVVGQGPLSEYDRRQIEASEAVRGYIDVQDGSAAHHVFENPKPTDAQGMYLQGTTAGPQSLADMERVEQLGAHFGLPDAVDTGTGVTMTNFMDSPFVTANDADRIKSSVDAMDQFLDARRMGVDSVYVDFSDAWRADVGSGAATRQLLDILDQADYSVLDRLDHNPQIAQNALDRMARDADWADKWGGTREDIENARRIIGQGVGWVGRLKQALADGAILPAIGLGILAMPQGEQERAM